MTCSGLLSNSYVIVCIGDGYKPACMHKHKSPDPVDILLVEIYVQGVFHLNPWKMKIKRFVLVENDYQGRYSG